MGYHAYDARLSCCHRKVVSRKESMNESFLSTKFKLFFQQFFIIYYDLAF